MITEVVHVETEAGDSGFVAVVTVRRTVTYTTTFAPRAEDLPPDLREALIKWLMSATPAELTQGGGDRG